jgi:hypothetical protein
MFDIRTTDRGRLRRIVVAGTGGLLAGMVLAGLNLVVPLVAGTGYGASNLAFGLFGLVAVVLATHPTYQAARRLDDSETRTE